MMIERIKPMIATAPLFNDIAPKTMPIIDGKIATKTSGAQKVANPKQSPLINGQTRDMIAKAFGFLFMFFSSLIYIITQMKKGARISLTPKLIEILLSYSIFG